MRKASANFVPRPRGQVFMTLSLTIQANEIPIWSRMNETVSQLRNLEVQTRTKNSVVLIKKTIWRGEWKLELIGETLERVTLNDLVEIIHVSCIFIYILDDFSLNFRSETIASSQEKRIDQIFYSTLVEYQRKWILLLISSNSSEGIINSLSYV